MTDVAQTMIDVQSLRASAKQLIDVRKRLARNMIVRTGGFEYESMFGCSDSPSEHPYVLVRVELRSIDMDGKIRPFRFDVFVDFSDCKGADVKKAEKFKRATDRAVKKAKWAENIVRGLVWDWKTISSLEVE